MSPFYRVALWLGLGLSFGLCGPVLAAPKIKQVITAPVPQNVAPSDQEAPLGHAAVQLVVSVGENDHLGLLISQGVRQQITQSPAFRLVETPNEAGLILHLVTLSPDTKNQITVYSETFTLAPHGARPEEFIFSTVTVCGEDRVKDCAAGIVKEMTNVLELVRRSLQQRFSPNPAKPPDPPSIAV